MQIATAHDPLAPLTPSEVYCLRLVHALSYDTICFRGETINGEDICDLLADVRADDIERAQERLDATSYGADRYAYVDEATGCAFIVDDDALADLGRRLAQGDEDAFFDWSRESKATIVEAGAVAKTIPAGADLTALRHEAAAADDIETVVALDLLREVVEALLPAKGTA